MFEFEEGIFDPSFFEEEERKGEIITREKKKIWAVQLQLALLLDKICKKYDLKYFMDFGTILGAVREKGFIPWDIDMDFCMMRPDYMKLLEVAPAEMPEYCTFQPDFLRRDCVKIRDDRTTCIYVPKLDASVSQGIFIDVAPLDDVADGKDFPEIMPMQHELLIIMHDPRLLPDYLKARGESALPMDMLRELVAMDPAEVRKIFYQFCLDHSNQSTMVANLYSYIGWGGKRMRSWYEETVYLPFEGFMFPAPKAYDAMLRAQYGDDYMTPVKRESDVEHMLFDTERPYTEYVLGGERYDEEYYKKNGLL